MNGPTTKTQTLEDDLRDQLTIILVTSPTASNPSTEMIDRCLQGIWDSFPSMAHCPVIVACDGVRRILEEKEETSASSKRASTRRVFGKCNRDQWDRYELYCDELACRPWLQVYRSEDWKGFALLLQQAIQMVSTPLVYVSPHDYELTPSTLERVQLPSLLQRTLLASSSSLTTSTQQPVHYIGLPNKRSATFGVRHENALQTIPSLQIDTPKGDYTLDPLAMWKENPHFATKQAYKDIVFSNTTFKKGQFIEDTLGQSMLASIKRDGLSAFQHLYLLALPTTSACSFHMDGPRYLPIAQRLERNYTVRDFEMQAAARASREVHQRQQLSQTSKLDVKA